MSLHLACTLNYKHRSALRGIPASASLQPEPNATELPSCAPISASRELRKDGGGGGGGVARRARSARAPMRTVLRYVLRRVLRMLVLFVSPKGSVGGGTRTLGVGSAAERWDGQIEAPSRPRQLFFGKTSG